MKTSVVIGAGYGDEGKGLMTDYLVEQAGPEQTIVVRFNGGAQAGHTVVRNGIRHVFGHFGSGSLQGARTYLSKYFVVNPMLFVKEHIDLLSKGVRPDVIIDSNAIITTPFDMLINQLLELSRGKSGRHGSCGVGFGETIERFEKFNHSTLYAWDLNNIDKLFDQTLAVRAQAVVRLMPIIEKTSDEEVKLLFAKLMDNNLMLSFRDDLIYLAENARVNRQLGFLATAPEVRNANLVFEGAQGLMLDMDTGAFPYVTRSNTGIKNARDLLMYTNREVEVYYMTRAYKTRHGAGPLSFEAPMPAWVHDSTNIHNRFQGSLRYAPLDLDVLGKAIRTDASGPYTDAINVVKNNICVTCVDQLPNATAEYILNGARMRTAAATLCRMLQASHISTGPTAADVSVFIK